MPAREKRISGTVVLSLTIDDSGKPQDIKVIAPLGFGLDENAIKAVKKWRFAPAVMHGQPIAAEVTFRLL